MTYCVYFHYLAFKYNRFDTIRPKNIDNKNDVSISESKLYQGPCPTVESHYHKLHVADKEEVTYQVLESIFYSRPSLAAVDVV